MGDAPAGACILYALSCNLSDRDLTERHDVLSRGRRDSSVDPDGDEGDEGNEPTRDEAGGAAEDSGRAGSRVALKPWTRRAAKSLGYPLPDGRPAPLIDQRTG